jgi:energy-coupling factor transporter ATP-binding protein EcfA2
VGIIGGNGAGKSTLFRMIMGQEVPDSGSLVVGDTVVPMWVDQSRSSLEGDKTVGCGPGVMAGVVGLGHGGPLLGTGGWGGRMMEEGGYWCSRSGDDWCAYVHRSGTS